MVEAEKVVVTGKEAGGNGHSNSDNGSSASHDLEVGGIVKSEPLKQELKNRHMQMIAIGGAVGAGLFVGSGKALATGGPASLMIGYLIVGVMLLFTCQALAEMAVLYPVNGAFYTYVVRFISPSWGFAVGWQYTLTWLTVLPFELIAASITIQFWDGAKNINIAVWVTLFLIALSVIQVFGVKGYGEVEFILSLIKVIACVGFMILGIIINVGAVGPNGYLGAKYWEVPGAFRGGFNGFCSVFVVAAFSFAGTELVGLAAAESANPRKAIPKASKQVFWRIMFFYVVNLFIVGLIVKSDDPRLMGGKGPADTKASPFVIAIESAGIKVLPSIMNAVVAIAVISVANSCTFGSTRTMQALAERGMAPRFLAYVDKKGRPLYCIIIQIAFGFLAYSGAGDTGKAVTAFNWLLAISGLSYFFVWGSICLAHIRFRRGWIAQGYSLEQIPYRPACGAYGSYVGLFLVIVCIVATFYVGLFPDANATPNAEVFFEKFIAAPIILLLWIGWKVYTGEWSLHVKANDMDLATGAQMQEPGDNVVQPERTWKNLPSQIWHVLF